MADDRMLPADDGLEADADLERMTAEGGADAPPVDPSAALAEEVAALRLERDTLYDRLRRQAAEFDNFRKRTERERKDTVEFAAAHVLQELLPVLDDFERALQADAGPQGHGYREGVELIHRQLLELLRSRGVTAIDAVGTDFDPHVHQAVEYADAPDHREGEVIAEYRRGYRLGDRLLRPALVKVARA